MYRNIRAQRQLDPRNATRSKEHFHPQVKVSPYFVYRSHFALLIWFLSLTFQSQFAPHILHSTLLLTMRIYITRLIEQSETHVIVRLLLFFLGLLFSSSLFTTGSGRRSSSSRGSGTTSRNGSQLGVTLGNQLCNSLTFQSSQQGRDSRLIDLGTNGFQQGRDIRGGRRGVSTLNQQQVCSQILHFFLE